MEGREWILGAQQSNNASGRVHQEEPLQCIISQDLRALLDGRRAESEGLAG